MNDAIGGYFQLELRKGEHYHKNAIRLNTARNCFEYILLARGYKKVYIPYYTCEVMLQPLIKNGVDYEFYTIDVNFEPTEIKHLKERETFLYTNYFGLKQSCVEKLSKIYNTQLIVDNAQAFYAPRINGIDTFYSPRKFFGVADGGYLYTDCLLEQNFRQDKSYMRMLHLLQRIDEGAEAGYKSFRASDDALDTQPIMKMSKLTEAILASIDYKSAALIRKNNFQYLHRYLSGSNELNICLKEDEVPMVYPYMVNDESLRKKLIDNRIFVAKYWPNVIEWCKNDTLEYDLTANIMAFPIDQRYEECQIFQITEILKNNNI